MVNGKLVKKALAIICYARWNYFELVFPSIINQFIHGQRISDIYDIYIFQDGLWSGEHEVNRTGHQKIGNWLENISNSIQVYKQEKNLGVAFHFDFVERLLFKEKNYDFVVFAEDDLIMAPGYMQAMDLMAEKFHDDPRVGMISAHPGNPTIPLEQQRNNSQKFTTMGHNWGFGLSRVFWEKRQPLVDYYLDLIRDQPYRNRPHHKIYKWLELIGFSRAASSQDFIKQCATVALGACRLSTFQNYGLPIGRTGLHCKPETFVKMGFDRTVVFDGLLKIIPDLDDDEFRKIYDLQLNQVGGAFVSRSNENTPINIQEWQHRLKAGEFNPKKILTMSHDHKLNSNTKKVWKSTDISTRPHMESEGLFLLESCLRQSKKYLEYGAGGSTVLAAEIGVEVIHSVDSDPGFLEAVRQKIAETGASVKINTHYADIGPTKEWGQPIDRSAVHLWPRYCVSPWESLNKKDCCPDLILIDGRFRVACFVASLLLAKKGTVILFDDYFDRPHYHVVENFLKPVKAAGRMAKFVVDSSFSTSEALISLMAVSTNPA